MLTWIWGVGNETYVAFLVFVPIVGVCVPFILGAKGYEWAWQNKHWESREQFLRNQKIWQRCGFGVVGFAVLAGFSAFSLVSFIMGIDDHNPTAVAVERIRAEPAVREALGPDIEKRFGYSGTVRVAGPSGTADVMFRLRGDRGSARASLTATREDGFWLIDRLVVIDASTGQELLRIEER